MFIEHTVLLSMQSIDQSSQLEKDYWVFSLVDYFKDWPWFWMIIPQKYGYSYLQMRLMFPLVIGLSMDVEYCLERWLFYPIYSLWEYKYPSRLQQSDWWVSPRFAILLRNAESPTSVKLGFSWLVPVDCLLWWHYHGVCRIVAGSRPFLQLMKLP